jgi:hypothetical protein
LVHEDYSELDAIYALLALTTYSDTRLGTFADAMEFYRQSLQATSRRVELYGARNTPDDIIRHVRHTMRASYQDPERPAAVARKRLDDASRWGAAIGDFLAQQPNVDKAKRDFCFGCQKQDGVNGIQLRKCSRCKHVYYCPGVYPCGEFCWFLQILCARLEWNRRAHFSLTFFLTGTGLEKAQTVLQQRFWTQNCTNETESVIPNPF